MTAVGNYWGGDTEEFAESVIFHRPDLGDNYGLVLYSPILTSEQEAIADNDEADISVYPNPTNGIVNVELNPAFGSLASEIQLFDIYGRQLQVLTIKDERIQIDLTQYATGIYLVKLVQGDKVVAMKKVVKN